MFQIDRKLFHQSNLGCPYRSNPCRVQHTYTTIFSSPEKVFQFDSSQLDLLLFLSYKNVCFKLLFSFGNGKGSQEAGSTDGVRLTYVYIKLFCKYCYTSCEVWAGALSQFYFPSSDRTQRFLTVLSSRHKADQCRLLVNNTPTAKRLCVRDCPLHSSL